MTKENQRTPQLGQPDHSNVTNANTAVHRPLARSFIALHPVYTTCSLRQPKPQLLGSQMSNIGASPLRGSKGMCRFVAIRRLIRQRWCLQRLLLPCGLHLPGGLHRQRRPSMLCAHHHYVQFRVHVTAHVKRLCEETSAISPSSDRHADHIRHVALPGDVTALPVFRSRSACPRSQSGCHMQPPRSHMPSPRSCSCLHISPNRYPDLTRTQPDPNSDPDCDPELAKSYL